MRHLLARRLSRVGENSLSGACPAKTYEAGVNERTVVIEFDSVDAAIATHDSPGYAAALAALDGGAIREIRIIEGLSAPLFQHTR